MNEADKTTGDDIPQPVIQEADGTTEAKDGVDLKPLNLSNRELKSIPPEMLDRNYKEIDLSGNELVSLRDLDPISSEIVTLNVSKNLIPENTEIPFMPNLKSLYATNNSIRYLDIFVENLCVMAPNLEDIMLANNQCHPGVLESQAKIEYRIYLASRFLKIKTIDGTVIKAFERNEAKKLLRLVGLE